MPQHPRSEHAGEYYHGPRRYPSAASMSTWYPTIPGTDEAGSPRVLRIKRFFLEDLVRLAEEMEVASEILQDYEHGFEKSSWCPIEETVGYIMLKRDASRASIEFWRYSYGFQKTVDSLSEADRAILRETTWAKEHFANFNISTKEESSQR